MLAAGEGEPRFDYSLNVNLPANETVAEIGIGPALAQSAVRVVFSDRSALGTLSHSEASGERWLSALSTLHCWVLCITRYPWDTGKTNSWPTGSPRRERACLSS